MELATALYISLLLHILGDYFLQSEWMTRQKTSNSLVCFSHVFVYSIPFLLITDPIWCFLLVLLPHFFIDRFSLGIFFIRLKNWNWKDYGNHGFGEGTPDSFKAIIYVAVDNGLHLFTNSVAVWLTYYLSN